MPSSKDKSKSTKSAKSNKSNKSNKSITAKQPPPSTKSEASLGDDEAEIDEIEAEANREEQELVFGNTTNEAPASQAMNSELCKDTGCKPKTDVGKFNMSQVSSKENAITCEKSKSYGSSSDRSTSLTSEVSIGSLTESKFLPSEQKGYCGLVNLGKTSYANSVVQMLFNWPKYKVYMFNHGHFNDGMHQYLADLFYQMQLALHKNKDPSRFATVTPKKFLDEFFKVQPEFSERQQNNAQEFLSALLDILHQEVNQASKLSQEALLDQPVPKSASDAWQINVKHCDHSFLSQYLMSQVQSMVTCRKCDFRSLSWSYQWQLQLQLGPNEPVADQSNSLTLKDCLANYFKSEVILSIYMYTATKNLSYLIFSQPKGR